MNEYSQAESIFVQMEGAPRGHSKRDTILLAASAVFIKHGYEGASMELVAQAAGAARRTLYNQFPQGKQQLFSEVTARMWRSFPVMNIATNEEALRDPLAGLRKIGYGIVAFYQPPLAIAFLRMVIGESRRFPELMESFFEFGKRPAVNAVQDYITALCQRGLLNTSNPTLAAQQFLGLIDETALWGRVMGDDAPLSSEHVSELVEQAVNIFVGYFELGGI